MKMIQVKKSIGYSKLKIWKIFRGHGEHEWPLVYLLEYFIKATYNRRFKYSKNVLYYYKLPVQSKNTLCTPMYKVLYIINFEKGYILSIIT